MDADMIGAFISSMINEALVHEFGRCKPRTTWELLDLQVIPPARRPSVQSFASIRVRHKLNPQMRLRTAIGK
jgi:hypothetical protein